jgi:hypothetical protein
VENECQFLKKKLKKDWNPTIALMGIYPKQLKIGSQSNIIHNSQKVEEKQKPITV